ncbi:hypothetical protein HYW53_00155 [Candidatus Giovannonibacteria bacterium]|nr:hypothetical protein [Candidatus Giovannonibacteria bacterium]
MSKDLLELSRKRKRRRALFKIYGTLGGIAVLFLVILFAFYYPKFRISSITVEGVAGDLADKIKTDAESILSKKYFYIFPKDNILIAATGEIKSMLESDPRFDQPAVEKKYPSTVVIKTALRKSWAVVCREGSENDCSLVDRSGFVFAKAPFLSGTAVLKIFDKRGENNFGNYVLPAGHFKNLVLLVEKVEEKLDEDIESVALKEHSEAELILKSDRRLIFDFELDPRIALENLSVSLSSELAILKDQIEYIDLRFPNKVFYRLKD